MFVKVKRHLSASKNNLQQKIEESYKPDTTVLTFSCEIRSYVRVLCISYKRLPAYLVTVKDTLEYYDIVSILPFNSGINGLNTGQTS